MFTGLIQDIGTVAAIEKKGDWRLRIETALDVSAMPEGVSISCSGVCLTTVQKGSGWFESDVSHETLSKTSISSWNTGTKINLEPSLRLGDELGGHFVFGHIDGVAEISEIIQNADSKIFKIKMPETAIPYIAPKGSVALDGISLTVNTVEKNMFSVNIIPHTFSHTTLGQKKAGDKLNLEIDMLARYVANILKKEAA